MIKIKFTFLIACVLLCSFAGATLIGCSSQSAGVKRVAFIGGTFDFWAIARNGCEKADAELPDLEVEFKIPPEVTAAEQKRIVDDLLARGIDGIALAPVDPVNQNGMINEAARQTVVITQDTDAPQSNRAAYVGPDNRAAGRRVGALIKEALPQGGKIMLFVGILDVENARERYEGVRESLQNSNIEIIDVRTDNAEIIRAKSNAADTIVAHPDIAGMVGLWAYNGPAILSAVRDAGKVGQIKIVCFDEESETLAGIRDGAIYATVVQQPFELGYQVVHLMSKLLRGDASAVPPGKQVVIPTEVVKKENVEAFTAKLNALRNRN